MLTCVIIDDEPKAIQLLELYCDRLSEINVLGSFRDPIKGLTYIQDNKPQVVFLDINMPHIKGNDLARIISHEVKIIFTTAYSEFAVESYELGAQDYLLKPISFDRFIKCLDNLKYSINQALPEFPFLIIKSGTTSHRVKPKEIKYLGKDGNYIYYYLDGKRIMARESIKESLSKLPSSFVQIHKSYIVNLDKVTSFQSDGIWVNEKLLPLSNKYREKVSHLLEPKKK